MPGMLSEIVNQVLTKRPALNLPRSFKLPCLPQSVAKFISISNDANAGARELAAPLEADSALTAALLRQVNSPAMGVRQAVASVPQAINLLGLRRTKNLVLASALQAATEKMSSRLINNTWFQKDNRARAAFARRTALEIGADGDVAYLAGLLQDFMLPMLTEAFHTEYLELWNKGRELVEEEERRFGWNHAFVAAGLMRDWGFPDELVACVLLHHDATRVVADASLRETAVGATVAAASLPESLHQSPAGFETLLELQKELPGFCFLTIASDVDEELTGGKRSAGESDGLCERLGKLAEANLEQQRLDRVQQHRQLGNYMLQDQIGEGAVGVIFKAQHSMLQRPAAIKLLRITNITPATLAQFESEVQLTSQLTSPNTVAVYDYGVSAEGLFYYVMEYLEGVNLGHIVRQTGPLPPGRAIHFLKQACSSLAEAHSRGLIHRDLKPENLMVCTRGGVPDTVKVLDFGLATIAAQCPDGGQAPVAICGTPHYMSPESVTAPLTVDHRSDLYSLGAVAYFLVTGQTVFPATTIHAVLRSHQSEVPVRPSVRLGTPIDSDLEEVILQCLSKSRDQRPRSAEDFSRMLGRCQSAGSWDPQEAIPMPPPRANSQLNSSLPEDTVDTLHKTIIACEA